MEDRLSDKPQALWLGLARDASWSCSNVAMLDCNELMVGHIALLLIKCEEERLGWASKMCRYGAVVMNATQELAVQHPR